MAATAQPLERRWVSKAKRRKQALPRATPLQSHPLSFTTSLYGSFPGRSFPHASPYPFPGPLTWQDYSLSADLWKEKGNIHLLKQKGWGGLYSLGITMTSIHIFLGSQKQKRIAQLHFGQELCSSRFSEPYQFYILNEKIGMDAWEEQVESYLREQKIMVSLPKMKFSFFRMC